MTSNDPEQTAEEIVDREQERMQKAADKANEALRRRLEKEDGQ
jgi:hypothetical protein